MLHLINRWTLAILALVIVIVIGAVIVAARYEPDQPVVITFGPPPETVGTIFIDGKIAAPGWYDLRPGDTLDGLIAAAGGTAGAGDNISLHIGTVSGAQKINLNTAAPWLLQALPGIGETRADAIVAYRESHGFFRDIDELVFVEGIGAALVEDVRPLVTVGE